MPQRVLVVGPAVLALATLVGCGAAPVRSPSIDQVEVVKAATFDHGCPPSDVRLLRAQPDAFGDGADFLVDVCGRERRYKRIGTVYFDEDGRTAAGGDPTVK